MMVSWMNSHQAMMTIPIEKMKPVCNEIAGKVRHSTPRRVAAIGEVEKNKMGRFSRLCRNHLEQESYFFRKKI
jgi:hypothetical protein